MSINIASLDSMAGTYRQLHTRYDAVHGIYWYYMKPEPRPCFTMDLLQDIRKCQAFMERINKMAIEQGRECPIRYGVLASQFPGIYSLGGDLDLFLRLIKAKDREGLTLYARACIDVVYPNATNNDVPMTTLSLVQGDAMGGGFESALSSTFIIAEKSTRLGFPEILFNLFPGMGAYTLLSRRVNPKQVERIITSGRIYSAIELYEMGAVDVLAEDGEGEKALYEFVRAHSRKSNAYQSLYKVRSLYHPVTYEELNDIAELWVDGALKLETKDLRLMERLVKAQNRLPNGTREPSKPLEEYA